MLILWSSVCFLNDILLACDRQSKLLDRSFFNVSISVRTEESIYDGG